MNTRQDDHRSAEQAAEHLDRVNRGGGQERKAFAGWLLESRRNVRQAMFVLAVEEELKHIDPQRKFDVDALLKSGREGAIELDSYRRRTSHEPRRKTWALGIAASVAIIASVFAWMLWPQNIQTATGEQQSVQLEDSSVVHLNTQTSIRVAFSDRAREIRLTAGEALFSVERDAARPFRVRVGDIGIQALGTQFNVNRHGPEIRVSVVDGSVQVSNSNGASRIVSAGNEVSVSPDGAIHPVSEPNVRRSIAWRERRLEFQEDPLSTVVQEFNRYNRAVKLRVDGDATGRRTYTGMFRADDPESLVQVLLEEKDLIIRRNGREVLIRSRGAKGN